MVQSRNLSEVGNDEAKTYENDRKEQRGEEEDGEDEMWRGGRRRREILQVWND